MRDRVLCKPPHVPNNNTGIILSIIPVIILVILYYTIVAVLKILSKSRHFQPTPVQTIDKTVNAVNRCEEVRKKECEEGEHETLLVSPLPSFLLVIIGYNKSIVL